MVQEGEGVCARGQTGDRTDGVWKRASYCFDASIRVDVQRRHLFRYTLDRSSRLRNERITYIGNGGGGAMATRLCDMSDSMRLTASHHHTSTGFMPAPSRPPTRRIPRSITPRYHTHYEATARPLGIRGYLQMKDQARGLWSRRLQDSSAEESRHCWRRSVKAYIPIH